jgi:hypothetical protein
MALRGDAGQLNCKSNWPVAPESLTGAETPSDNTAIQRQIDATDRQIDQLVYELYGLTDEEIKIVEEATKG